MCFQKEHKLIRTGELPSAAYSNPVNTVASVVNGNCPVRKRIFLSSKEPSQIHVRCLHCYKLNAVGLQCS